MKLKDLLNTFHLSEDERAKVLAGDKLNDFDNKNIEGKKEYIPESFKDIAKNILAGYFEIRVGNDVVRKVHPTCVEIYYHEEEDTDAIKDYIVYHRNRSKKFNSNPSLLHIGAFNAHQSGIDITFEHETIIHEKKVQVRASALIRAFKVEVLDSKYNVDTIDINVNKIDKRSTYLYNALLSNLPVLEGFSIKWVDGEVNNGELKMDFRQNVLPCGANGKIVAKKNEEGIINDGRCWQFHY